jgi:hypothetical protein
MPTETRATARTVVIVHINHPSLVWLVAAGGMDIVTVGAKSAAVEFNARDKSAAKASQNGYRSEGFFASARVNTSSTDRGSFELRVVAGTGGWLTTMWHQCPTLSAS